MLDIKIRTFALLIIFLVFMYGALGLSNVWCGFGAIIAFVAIL